MLRALSLVMAAIAAAAASAQAPGRGVAAALSLQGRVFDELGEPVPAATVEVRALGERGRHTATDAAGRFLLVGVPEGSIEVTFAAPGKATIRRQHLLVPGRQVLVGELCDAVPLRGRVVDAAGQPVAGAAVLLFAEGRCEVRSDDRGQFVFPAARVGRGVLRAFGSQSFATLDLDVQEGVRVEVRLPPNGIASRIVRVLDLPEAAARIAHVRVLSFEGLLSPAAGRVALAGDGTASVQVLSTSLVELVAPGYQASPRGALVESAATTPIELRAVRIGQRPAERAVLRGRTVDEHDRPLGGLALRVETFDDRIVGRGVVAADGTFAVPLELPEDQPCRVCVDRSEHYVVNVGAKLRGRECEVTISQAAEELVLEFERGGAVVAQACTETGDRPMLREVHVACADRPWSTLLPTFCDEDGLIELRGLPADEYLLRTCTDEGDVLWATARVLPGHVTEALRWRSATGGVVQGRVQGGDGAPVGGLVLRLWQCDRPDAMAATADAWCTVRTDRLGRYRRAALPAGEWRLAADGSDALAPVAFDVRPGEAAIADVPLAMPPR